MNSSTILKLATSAVVGVTALVILGGSFYTIDQGERGVVLRNGKIVAVSDAGLHFKLPIISEVVTISTQSHAMKYDNVLAYSFDQQTAGMTVSVNYAMPEDQMELIYSQYGGRNGVVSRLLDRQVPNAIKNVFGNYTAVRAIQDREVMVLAIEDAIRASVKGPIIIESVQVENIDFSDAYEGSVEDRMLAEVEVQRIQQNAEREKVQAEILVIQAEAAAAAHVAKAQAEATAIRLRGEAEADAITARGKALAANPELVSLVQAERWNGVLPTTMIPNSVVPFLDVN